MEWMPEDMWLTYLTLDEAAGDLDYDLSAGTADRRPSLRDAGLSFASVDRAADAIDPADDGVDIARIVAWSGLAAGLLLLAVAGGLKVRSVRS
jgi:hypothetical protein